jgi:Na+-driven multidrug efflux pump
MNSRIGKRTERMLHASIVSLLFSLAAPNMVAMIVSAALSVNEAYLASRSGVDSIAGLGVVFPFVMFMQALSIGAFGGAASSAVARLLGASDPVGAGVAAGAAVIVGLGAALTFLAVMVPFGSEIYDLLGASEGVATAAHAYGAIFFGGSVFIWIFHTWLAILRGTGDMRTPSAASLCISALAAFLSYVLCLGLGPIPALGLKGIALGYVCSHAVGTLFLGAYIISGRCGLKVGRIFHGVVWTHCVAILKVALPAALNSTITALVAAIGLFVVGSFGEEALAAFSLGARLEYLLVPIVAGLGAAVLTVVATCIGCGHELRAERVAWAGVAIAFTFVAAISLAVALFPQLWLGLFLDDLTSRVSQVGRSYLVTVGPAYAFFAVGLTLYFACQGAMRMRWSVWANVLRLAVMVGLLAAKFLLDLSLLSTFLIMAVGMLAYGLSSILALRYLGLSRKAKG